MDMFVKLIDVQIYIIKLTENYLLQIVISKIYNRIARYKGKRSPDPTVRNGKQQITNWPHKDKIYILFCGVNIKFVNCASDCIYIKVNQIRLASCLEMIQQNQVQFPKTLFNLKYSDKFSDILSFHPSLSQFNLDCFHKQSINDSHMEDEIELENQVTSEKAQEYFNLLFSSKLMATYLINRNNELEIKCLENQDSEPDEIYHKRKQRVTNLLEKQRKNWEILATIKVRESEKYQALIKFMKLFGEVKLKLNGLRHDYYSQKTFSSLKKASSHQINTVTKILGQILVSVFQMPQKYSHFQKNKGIDQRYVEFLIIPRFFVSKQKILRFIKDQQLQRNFQFLIYHGCLGHYNNEANKKYPEEHQMSFIRCLLDFEDGKQKFKRICGINHGGKFFKKFGDLYFKLYERSLQSLKNIDLIWKKNCTQQQIRQEITRDSKTIEKLQKQYGQYFLFDHRNQIRNFNIFEFNQIKSISSFLNVDVLKDLEPKLTNSSSQLKATTLELNFGALDSSMFKSRNKLRRPYSLMFENKEYLELQSKFKVKRWNTMDTYDVMRALKQKNIIIIHPPNQNTMYSSINL